MKRILFAVALLLSLFAIPASAQDTNMVITPTVVGNGTIDPDTGVVVNIPDAAGDSSASFTIAGASGYYIDSVVVNGVNLGRVYSYSFVAADSGDTVDYDIIAYFGSTQVTINEQYWLPSATKMVDGVEFALFRSYPAYIAYDSMLIYSPVLKADIGGVNNVYAGIKVLSMTDTVDQNLVVECSFDSSTWIGIDSVAVGTPETVGTYYKNFALADHRVPFWRLRFGASNIKWKGDVTGVPRLYFFISVNIKERW